MDGQNRDADVSAQQIIQNVRQNPDIPESAKHEIIAEMMSITAFSGPIPPPEILAEYDRIFPGAAKQIFSMAEAQSNHRMAIEKKVITSATIDSKLGIIAGLIVALAVIGSSLYVINRGHTLSGFVLIVGTLAAIVYSFRYGVNDGKRELGEKDKHLRQG